MKLLATIILCCAMVSQATTTLAQSSGSRNGDGGDANAGLSNRVRRLEEQVDNMQGVIAAVESLARNNPNNSAYPAGNSASSQQLRELSRQVSELSQRISRLEARGAGDTLPSNDRRGDSGQDRSEPNYGSTPNEGFDKKEPLPPLVSQNYGDDTSRKKAEAPFQSKTYDDAPNENKASSRSPSANSGYNKPRSDIDNPPSRNVGSSSGGSRELYDQGVSAFNKKEYQVAETSFQQFLEQSPSDAMAANAQYWLGETAYASGDYTVAAKNFLKTFTNYPASDKAPEALLKLAISLRRSGKNDEACDTFSELKRRFPQLSQSVAQRAESEKRRANCN